jgi:hypothetical protein
MQPHASKRKPSSKSLASRPSWRNWRAGGTNSGRTGGIVLHSMFETGQALLLSSLRILRPRNGRGESANQPRNMNCSRPTTRHFHEHEQATTGSQSRSIHVQEQSASAFSPRPQTRQQSVCDREQDAVLSGRRKAAATDANSPQIYQSAALSTSEVSTRTGNRRELEVTTNSPRRRVAVNFAPDTGFTLHIRTISNHVLI